MIHWWGLKTWNDQSVQEIQQYFLLFLPLIYRNVQLSWTHLLQPARDVSMCSGIVDAYTEAICHAYTSPIVYTVMCRLLWTGSGQLDIAVDQR